IRVMRAAGTVGHCPPVNLQESSMVSATRNISPLIDASEALARAVDEVAHCVVAVLASRHGPASGVLWRPGVVVTTAHTIRRDDGIRVVLPDGTRSDAVLAGVDTSTD